MDPPKKLVKRNTAIGLKELISRNSRSSLFGENKKGVFNISIVGESGVGKSALMVRLLTGFSENFWVLFLSFQGRFIGEYADIYTTGESCKFCELSFFRIALSSASSASSAHLAQLSSSSSAYLAPLSSYSWAELRFFAQNLQLVRRSQDKSD